MFCVGIDRGNTQGPGTCTNAHHSRGRHSSRAGFRPRLRRSRLIINRCNRLERNDMAALPLIVFDVNETLLDPQTMEPTFERIFGEKGAMRMWFANFIRVYFSCWLWSRSRR